MSRYLGVAHHKARIIFFGSSSAIVCLLSLFFCYEAVCGVMIAPQNRDKQSPDGPISVKLGDVYQKGDIKIEDADLSKLPSLPRGYSAMPKMAFRITTDAVAVGPYTVVFGVPSITDEAAFKSLRVFHAEPDEYDPDSFVWVDRTASSLDAPAPDFSHKTITAYSDELATGVYIIARLTEKIPSSTAVADLEVVADRAPEVVQMPANIILSVIVKNNGPQAATNVGLKQQIPRGPVVSMKASQGTCKWKPGWVYCKLGQLATGASATLAVEFDPSPDFQGLYSSSIEVGANEIESNPDNNLGVASSNTRGDPNLPPEVTLEGPAMEELFEPGATVVFKATAKDPDGSITKVEFLDNDQSVGIGATTDAKNFSFSSNRLSNGRHVLNAIATDNGGRKTRSNAKHIFVNGPIKVRILEPKAESVITPGADLTLTAEAIHPSGSIKDVEFFRFGMSLGQVTQLEDNRFTLTLRNIKSSKYYIEAIATDEAGSVSKSPLLELKVSTRPTVRITTPANGASLMGPVNIEVTTDTKSIDSMDRVEVYANGVLIEEGSMVNPKSYRFTWEDAPSGKYTLKAVVIDEIGVRGESSPINVVIKPRHLKGH